jgi:hypothetical protein
VKKSLIYLIVLLFVAATAWAANAGTKTTTAKACAMDSTCAKKCAEKGIDAKTCAKMCAEKAAAAQTSGDKTADPHAACPMMNKASEKTDASSKDAAVVPVTAEENKAAKCPMHMDKVSVKEATPAVTIESSSPDVAKRPAMPVVVPQAADEKISVKVPEGTCPDVSGNNQLTTFHKAMEPIHEAVNAGKYEELTNLVPKLQEASKSLADYKCPNSSKCSPECLKNFESKKNALIKSVDELSLASKTNDSKKVDESFSVMHSAFIDFAGLCTAKAEVKSAIESK